MAPDRPGNCIKESRLAVAVFPRKTDELIRTEINTLRGIAVASEVFDKEFKWYHGRSIPPCFLLSPAVELEQHYKG